MSECKEINTWLTGIDAKPRTEVLYKKTIMDFCRFLEQPTDKLIKGYISEIKEGLLMPERSIFHDVPRYLESLKKRNLSPMTIHTYKSAVKSFFKYYYIEFPNIKNGKVKPLEANANRFLTKDQVKHVLDYTVNIRNKAMIMAMSTSGMAANEIINLKVGQISFDKDSIGTIKLRREKVQFDYFTFISPEAVKLLKEYWKERERRLDKKLSKTDYCFTTRYENNMNIQVFMNTFQDIARRAGYEKGTKKRYCDIRSHAFRKFFSNSMQQAGMIKDDVDSLLGHVPDGTDQAYFSTDIEKLKKKYIKHLSSITLKEEIVIRSLSTEDAEKLSQQEKIIQNQGKELEDLKKTFKLFLENKYKIEAGNDMHLQRRPEEFTAEPIRPNVKPTTNKSVDDIKEISKNFKVPTTPEQQA